MKTPKKEFNYFDEEMTLNELNTPQKSFNINKNNEYSEKIQNLNSNINFLIKKVDIYSKNTCINNNYSLTPKNNNNKNENYKGSPFGKKLKITDYSTFLSKK